MEYMIVVFIAHFIIQVCWNFIQQHTRDRWKVTAGASVLSENDSAAGHQSIQYFRLLHIENKIVAIMRFLLRMCKCEQGVVADVETMILRAQ